jgi:hypothetical protein
MPPNGAEWDRNWQTKTNMLRRSPTETRTAQPFAQKQRWNDQQSDVTSY